MPEWAANQWISTTWIYGLAAALVVSALVAAGIRIYYRRSSSEPRWVGRLFDILQICLMLFVFLVFARIITGFWH